MRAFLGEPTRGTHGWPLESSVSMLSSSYVLWGSDYCFRPACEGRRPVCVWGGGGGRWLRRSAGWSLMQRGMSHGWGTRHERLCAWVRGKAVFLFRRGIPAQSFSSLRYRRAVVSLPGHTSGERACPSTCVSAAPSYAPRHPVHPARPKAAPWYIPSRLTRPSGSVPGAGRLSFVEATQISFCLWRPCVQTYLHNTTPQQVPITPHPTPLSVATASAFREPLRTLLAPSPPPSSEPSFGSILVPNPPPVRRAWMTPP